MSNSRLWIGLTALFFLISIGLLVALVIVSVKLDDKKDDGDLRTCGSSSSSDDVIDLSEPLTPGPFHDLTSRELIKLRSFLIRDTKIRADIAEHLQMNSSSIFAADLFLPPKADVLRYLDGNGPQPPRQARVMIFRGDLSTPRLEEYICGPLPDVSSCKLMNLKGRRNPAQYSLRPFSDVEFGLIRRKLLAYIDKELGYILLESYGTRFTECDDMGLCLGMTPNPVGTGLFGDIDDRRMWVTANYFIEHRVFHNLNFGALLSLNGNEPSKWFVDKVWYAGRLYHSMDELIVAYNSSSIPVSRVNKPSTGPDLFARMTLKGDPWPNPPKRPPKLVEPDGKRYKVKDRKVEYMDWTFHFRLSSFTGAALNDVRFKGERIVYDMGLQELSVFYSGLSPLIQTTAYVDSGILLGTNSKALVAGGDCPDSAIFINQTFMAQTSSDVAEFKRAICLFENNEGYPLRRHLTYSKFIGSVYTGMLNSALTLRTAMTIGNYDYIIDYIFHQNGVLETKWMSSGYVMSSFYSEGERNYAFRLNGFRGAPLHHHMAHFKVDLDVSGTSNRYETLDITAEDVPLTMDTTSKLQITEFARNLKRTELEAVYQFDFNKPTYHLVHNEAKKNEEGQMKAYRLEILGVSKQLRHKRLNNEVSIPWARNQLVVTKYKDEEFWSSSSYAMWDSADPVVDFSKFYTDNDDIVDQDLVAWVSLGVQHIPRSEDIPVTTTIGNQQRFLLMPFNYYPYCPSMRSRDAIRLTHHDVTKPEDGIKLNRHGNPHDQCMFPKPDLEREIEEDPDSVLESKKISPLF